MKKIFLSLLFLAILSSCKDMLVEVPKDFISKANFYKNEADAEGAIAGVYSSFREDYYGINYYLFVELHADYLNGRGSQAGISYFDKVLDPTNIGRAEYIWSNLYRAINRSNSVIANVPSIENIDENVKTRIMAEAYFLRAMAYFNLVRGFGPIPIKTTESTDLSSLHAPREPESKVYELILDDALEAEKGLPETVGSETGRASKWAAKMLLAQIYLTLEDWPNAAEKANEVINSGQFTLVQVNEPDDFYNIFATETNPEDIMSVHHSETKNSAIPVFIHRPNTIPYNYGSDGYYAWLPIVSGDSFIGDSWDDNDLRKSFNLYTEYQEQGGEWVPLPSSTPILFKKFVTNTDGLAVYSTPIYRYTEAFLIYAEASCMADGSPSAQALERLNKIKRRAYGYDLNSPSPVDYPSGLSKDDFRKIVLQERGYEFILEQRRWWDLKRTGMEKEAMAAIGKTFIDARYFWPIPEDEINNNILINQENQNPGY